MKHNKNSTEYLNQKLLGTGNLSDFFNENKDGITKDTFGVALGKLIDKKEITNGKLFTEANISQSTGYQILSSRRLPSREKVLQLTIGLSLNLQETNKLLRLSKHGELYVKEKRDAIIIYSINNSLSIFHTNELLHEENFKVLE